jgi:hypothetical protein
MKHSNYDIIFFHKVINYLEINENIDNINILKLLKPTTVYNEEFLEEMKNIPIISKYIKDNSIIIN